MQSPNNDTHKKEPHRIFELDFFMGVFIMSIFLSHIVLFISHYLGIWVGGITVIDWPYYFYYFGLNFILFKMGITLTFSKHNAKRGFSLLVIWAISCMISFLLYYKNSMAGNTYNNTFLYLDYTMFWYYALYIFLFIWVIRLPFTFQIYIVSLLLVIWTLSLLNTITMPSVNPLYWIGIDRYLNMPADKGEYLFFPGIISFTMGTLIGQLYYKNKVSPFKTEKYSNFMQKYKFTRLTMWCGANSLKCFVAQAVILPVIFGLITLIIQLF